MITDLCGLPNDIFLQIFVLYWLSVYLHIGDLILGWLLHVHLENPASLHDSRSWSLDSLKSEVQLCLKAYELQHPVIDFLFSEMQSLPIVFGESNGLGLPDLSESCHIASTVQTDQPTVPRFQWIASLTPLSTDFCLLVKEALFALTLIFSFHTFFRLS